MNQRARILVNAANLCIRKAARMAESAYGWQQYEFAHAVCARHCHRREAALERANAAALAKAYATTAVSFIKRI